MSTKMKSEGTKKNIQFNVTNELYLFIKIKILHDRFLTRLNRFFFQI